MSRVSEAKEMQGYQQKPVQRRCRVCSHVRTRGDFDKKFTCTLGNFAVKANAICDKFAMGENI